jgi:hypothetical protein
MDALMMLPTRSFVIMFQILAMMERIAQMIPAMQQLDFVFILINVDLYVKRMVTAVNGEPIANLQANAYKLPVIRPKDSVLFPIFLM